MYKGLLIVVSGASGTGKGTVCKKLLEDMPKISYSVSATTRAARPGETDGKEYYFLSRAEFEERISKNDFLEYAEVYGNYYGTPLNEIETRINSGESILLEIDTQGALKVKDRCPEGVFIFLLPPSLAELRKRIEGRGTETPEVLEKRFNAALEEISVGKKYDYVVVNDEVEKAVEKIKAVISAESCKVSRNLNEFEMIGEM